MGFRKDPAGRSLPPSRMSTCSWMSTTSTSPLWLKAMTADFGTMNLDQWAWHEVISRRLHEVLPKVVLVHSQRNVRTSRGGVSLKRTRNLVLTSGHCDAAETRALEGYKT